MTLCRSCRWLQEGSTLLKWDVSMKLRGAFQANIALAWATLGEDRPWTRSKHGKAKSTQNMASHALSNRSPRLRHQTLPMRFLYLTWFKMISHDFTFWPLKIFEMLSPFPRLCWAVPVFVQGHPSCSELRSCLARNMWTQWILNFRSFGSIGRERCGGVLCQSVAFLVTCGKWLLGLTCKEYQQKPDALLDLLNLGTTSRWCSPPLHLQG